MKKITCSFLGLILSLSSFSWANAANTNSSTVPPQLQERINQIVLPIMSKDHIPGIAIAVHENHRDYYLNYGVSSQNTKQPITNHTLFSIASVTKTFTAALAAVEVQNHQVKLSTPLEALIPELHHTVIGQASLLELLTHTTELPLDLPETIKTMPDVFQYLKTWKPIDAFGTHRIYTSVGIGLAAEGLAEMHHTSYQNLLTHDVLDPLGLHHTFVKNFVTNKEYAQGYKKDGQPYVTNDPMVFPGGYGLVSCTHDLIHYVDVLLGESAKNTKVAKALHTTNTAYFKTNVLQQDLVWEQYPLPVSVEQVLAGDKQVFGKNPVQAIQPPQPPLAAAYINKTGSGFGFKSYVAYIPAEHIGVVVLANKEFNETDRIKLAYAVLHALNGKD